MSFPKVVDFGAEICGTLETAAEREWLVTNGRGGFASGTISGALTRRYHGLLMAALDSPARRMLLVSKFDETLRYDGRTYELGANRWGDSTVTPEGFRLIERFHLEGTTPVWTFACADALLEKRVWMQDGANTTFVRYDLVRCSSGSAELEIKALVNYCLFHAMTRAGDWRMNVAPIEHGLRVVAWEGAVPFYLLSDVAQAEPRNEWYRGFELAAERSRGLDDQEDHLFAGVFRARLGLGESVTLTLSTDLHPPLEGRAALAEHVAFEEKLLEYWVAAHPQASLDAPPWIRQLVLAAAQFPIRCSLPGEPDAFSVIAGYPWFGAWGRDTMMALPGLALETGRPDLARSILQASARFIDQGMLPNAFPDEGRPPTYNSVDAALWYIEAVRQYHSTTPDLKLVSELYDKLTSIIDWHVHGTRYSIHMDTTDGLLHAGEPGVQLTWMDAKVADQVITPRTGKPVEVNALWYNALHTMSAFASELGKPAEDYTSLAGRVRESFSRFWNPEAGYCFDVLDGPDGNDASLRPNQILAASLPESPLTPEQQKAVVDVCTRQLVTPHGLRSLDASDPRYQGYYGGQQATRDAAYHQGTVWGWLLGPFVLAHLRAYHDPQLAFTFLEPMAHHLLTDGVGSISEIFDGDPPFTPRGAIAQAWSVAEVLRAWRACHDAGLTPQQLPVGH